MDHDRASSRQEDIDEIFVARARPDPLPYLTGDSQLRVTRTPDWDHARFDN
jgi:hypothetical protein